MVIPLPLLGKEASYLIPGECGQGHPAAVTFFHYNPRIPCRNRTHAPASYACLLQSSQESVAVLRG